MYIQRLECGVRRAVRSLRLGTKSRHQSRWHSVLSSAVAWILSRVFTVCANSISNIRWAQPAVNSCALPAACLSFAHAAGQATAPNALPAVASPSSSSKQDGEHYYGHFIPHKKPEGAGQNYMNNLKAKIRQQVKKSLASKKLQQAGAPEAAAAAPADELPQNPKAADHQKEYLRRLQDVQEQDAAAKARHERPKAKKDSSKGDGKKQQQQAPVAKAAKESPKASSKASSDTRASSSQRAARASPGASTSQAKASVATAAETSSNPAESPLGAVGASSDAQPASAPTSASPSVAAAPKVAADSSTPSNSDWRLQQKQWQASHTPRAMPASAGIDLLQSSPGPQPPGPRKPGFKGRGPGRPNTPYAPLGSPPPQPEEEVDPELSPEEQQQQEEAMGAAVRWVAFQTIQWTTNS